MSDDVWNDDIAYVFSTQRTFMQIFGIWPLQKRTTFRIIQWIVIVFFQLSPYFFAYMEVTQTNNADAGSNIEVMLYFISTVGLNLKFLCLIANGGKMAKNINAAIADWLSVKNDNEKSYKIMKEHASKSRLCTLCLLYVAATCGSLYILSVVFVNLKQIFLEDQTALNDTHRSFIILCGDIGNKINDLQYVILLIYQSLLLLFICTTQPITDSFYINITLHIAGQLKVLKTKFKIFARKPDSQANYRKQFSRLIDRHCELTKLNQNIEDTFHLIILFQLVAITLLLALLGLRIIVCLKNNNYVELSKSFVLMNYLFLQSLLYCFGGDFVQKGSEGIIRAMFMASWFTLPTTMMKDFNFAIMRSKYLFRLTGGKFFYANCEAMVYILKTIASYVSVLRMSLRD